MSQASNKKGKSKFAVEAQIELEPLNEHHENFEVLGSSLEYAAKEAAVADGVLVLDGQQKMSDFKPKKIGLRRGKWTSEEEGYANRLILEFKAGCLPLTDGTTLRTFLSKLLNCDPMRISKKFVGGNCIGKQVFRRRQQDLDGLTQEQMETTRKELAILERKFMERVAQTNRIKAANTSGKGDEGDILAPWMRQPDSEDVIDCDVVGDLIFSHPHIKKSHSPTFDNQEIIMHDKEIWSDSYDSIHDKMLPTSANSSFSLANNERSSLDEFCKESKSDGEVGTSLNHYFGTGRNNNDLDKTAEGGGKNKINMYIRDDNMSQTSHSSSKSQVSSMRSASSRKTLPSGGIDSSTALQNRLKAVMNGSSNSGHEAHDTQKTLASKGGSSSVSYINTNFNSYGLPNPTSNLSSFGGDVYTNYTDDLYGTGSYYSNPSKPTMSYMAFPTRSDAGSGTGPGSCKSSQNSAMNSDYFGNKTVHNSSTYSKAHIGTSAALPATNFSRDKKTIIIDNNIYSYNNSNIAQQSLTSIYTNPNASAAVCTDVHIPFASEFVSSWPHDDHPGRSINNMDPGTDFSLPDWPSMHNLLLASDEHNLALEPEITLEQALSDVSSTDEILVNDRDGEEGFGNSEFKEFSAADFVSDEFASFSGDAGIKRLSSVIPSMQMLESSGNKKISTYLSSLNQNQGLNQPSKKKFTETTRMSLIHQQNLQIFTDASALHSNNTQEDVGYDLEDIPSCLSRENTSSASNGAAVVSRNPFYRVEMTHTNDAHESMHHPKSQSQYTQSNIETLSIASVASTTPRSVSGAAAAASNNQYVEQSYNQPLIIPPNPYLRFANSSFSFTTNLPPRPATVPTVTVTDVKIELLPINTKVTTSNSKGAYPEVGGNAKSIGKDSSGLSGAPNFSQVHSKQSGVSNYFTGEKKYSAAAGTGNGNSSLAGGQTNFQRNSSVDDFMMLVNLGDLPRPDSGVLSETLWCESKGGAAFTDVVVPVSAVDGKIKAAGGQVEFILPPKKRVASAASACVGPPSSRATRPKKASPTAKDGDPVTTSEDGITCTVEISAEMIGEVSNESEMTEQSTSLDQLYFPSKLRRIENMSEDLMSGDGKPSGVKMNDIDKVIHAGPTAPHGGFLFGNVDSEGQSLKEVVAMFGENKSMSMIFDVNLNVAGGHVSEVHRASNFELFSKSFV